MQRLLSTAEKEAAAKKKAAAERAAYVKRNNPYANLKASKGPKFVGTKGDYGLSKNRFYVYVKRSDLQPWHDNYVYKTNSRGGLKVPWTIHWKTVENRVISHFKSTGHGYRLPSKQKDDKRYTMTHKLGSATVNIVDFVFERKKKPGFPKPYDVKLVSRLKFGQDPIAIPTSPLQLRLMEEQGGTFIICVHTGPTKPPHKFNMFFAEASKLYSK